MFTERLKDYQRLENERNSKLLVYVTGERPGLETQMHNEVIDMFTEHLDKIGKTEKISLVLHSRGGETNTGWSLANLIRSFCSKFEVIIPARAHSAATLLSLGADTIMMTKQATIGPIDPSVNTPLNPELPGAPPQTRVSVSVESIKGFVQLAREEFSIDSSRDLTKVLSVLADKVHPLVLGDVFRARQQIRMLAERLLEMHFDGDVEKIKKIVDFLCSDSGSHNYTIDRYEAADYLGLNIEKPHDNLYSVIKEIYDDLEKELEFKHRYNANSYLGTDAEKKYCFRRALIESPGHGTDVYVSEGILVGQQQQTQTGLIRHIQDMRQFEGWRKENEQH